MNKSVNETLSRSVLTVGTVLLIAVALFFLVYMAVADPRNTGLGLLLTAAGVPAYLYWRRHR